MKRIVCLLLILAAMLSLTACMSGKPEILNDSDLEIFHIDEKDDNVVEDDDWDDFDAQQPEAEPAQIPQAETSAPEISEDGVYTSRDEVALYIHTYGRLPDNYITKKQAQKLGWDGGKLEPYAPGKSIGGDYFGNYEGKLPKAKGRTWTECDINTLGKRSRGAERIIFSNDGLIYYTEDHYESYTQLY